MFSIKQITENGFNKIILQDDNTKTTAAIIPACGAILHAFSISHNNRMLNIINSYDSFDDYSNNITAKGFKECKLSPFACRLNKGEYSFAGQHYKIEKFFLGDHAIHGLIYDAVFLITEIKADDNAAAVTMQYEYCGNDKGYPFNYDCIITYTLEKNNRLSLETSIINKSNGLIPVQDGWHPYFTFGGSINELQLEFQSKEMIEFNEDLIPTGKLIPFQQFGSLKIIGDTFLDNCFTVNFAECQPICVLRDPVQGIQLEIHPETSYPYLQIYTPSDRKSIAIENLSAAPDAFNNGMGLKVLAAGETASFKTMYKISS
ncbi:MAG: aldose 1-epimerase [Ferruginibacter sp.]